jgi:hypothetical protein
MSANILKLISTDASFAPEAAAIAAARSTLAAALPDAHKIEANLHPTIEFIDPGGNWEGVRCANCGTNLDDAWWAAVVENAYEKRFIDLTVYLPCCSVWWSLNDLDYVWPAGFARFSLEATDPNGDLTVEQIAALERILGTRLKRIWAHY